ncbi:MAG: hypothetical protein JO097_01980 [Acidobacteriaceae bacterium]|nr:hypothetical protein [Acidobacteriaceae bacterium]MBV9763832.1 hypothetical protein [Acidobacteriaceae bacterium]
MRSNLLILLFLAGSFAHAQETQLQADFRHEKEDLQKDCSGSFFKAIAGCAQDLFTDHPLHIAAGSIAPQNGFGLGPAFVAHHTPNERWRLSWNVDAIATTNASWRAGAYMKAIYIPRENIGVITTTPGQPPKSNLSVREYPVINVYAQGILLNTIDYYGLGNFTPRSGETVFGMQETIAGANAIVPIVPKLKLSLFGEMNGRFVNIRPDVGEATPSIETLYNGPYAPGIATQPGFLQLGEGVRLRPILFSDHLQLKYQFTFQEFLAPGSQYSFNRLSLDLSHEFPIYGNFLRFQRKEFNGPDECAVAPGGRCPAVTRDRSGSFGLRFLYSESFVSTGNTVPFYFQPTLGGSDIDGNQFLPSYHDYRFRAPNLLLLRGTFEHSIWGPLGFVFMADTGKVALTHSEIGFNHLKHSFAAGLNLRAGGFPVASLLFAFGGNEGTHNIMYVDPSLLGGSARPSLY